MASAPTTNSNEDLPFKKARLLGSLDEVITLLVGTEEAPVVVHKNILCAYSPFFEVSCKPEWMRLEDKTIKSPEDDLMAIKGMVYWMYNNGICTPSCLRLLPQDHLVSRGDAMNSIFGFFVKLYCLGEKYQIQRLRNNAIDAIIARRNFADIPSCTISICL